SPGGNLLGTRTSSESTWWASKLAFLPSPPITTTHRPKLSASRRASSSALMYSFPAYTVGPIRHCGREMRISGIKQGLIMTGKVMLGSLAGPGGAIFGGFSRGYREYGPTVLGGCRFRRNLRARRHLFG